MTTTTDLPVGTRVRLTGDIGGAQGRPGKTGVIVGGDDFSPTTCRVKLDGETSGGAYGEGVYCAHKDKLEVIPAPAGVCLSVVPQPWDLEAEYVVAEDPKRALDLAPRSVLTPGLRVKLTHAHPDGDGEVYVSLPDRTDGGYIAPSSLLLVSTEAEEATPESDLNKVFHITADETGHGFPVDTEVRCVRVSENGTDSLLCTILEAEEGETLPASEEYGSRYRWEYAQTAWVRPGEREIADPAILVERYKAEAERLRTLHTDFKELVRSKVIEEAQAQGWCSRTDSWLTELGLPNRFEGIPTGRHSVVRLKDGRLAVLSDSDSEPWSVKRVEDGKHDYWASFTNIASSGVETVIHVGDTSDEIEPR